ncbi:LysR family transcriptional regulator [Tropicimonas sp. S265A]|uniref:LysR family transcriptional regulator n=1 Tax=Tropicimonas sp. S265A TaxID=3415134 RepID=UPI003C7C9DF1
MPNAQRVKALAHAVREGSFSAAARRMGLSQSAVSQHISKLETEVGAQLLVRGRDGITLTATGQELFELADEFAALDQQITERLRGHAQLDRGHLKIIANAPQPALSLIERYTSRYDNISVDFALFDWASAMDRVKSKRVDIALITAPAPQPDLVVIPIVEAKYVLYARIDHPLAARERVRLQDVAAHTLVLPEKGSLTQRVVTQALENANLVPHRIVTMTTFPVMKEAILQGVGVGIFLQNSSVAEERLREVEIEDLQQNYSTAIVIPKHKYGLRITRSFLEILD